MHPSPLPPAARRVGPRRSANAALPCTATAATTSSSTQLQLAASLEQRVTEFTLPNGLHVITLTRPAAPIVSCHTYANIGAYDEEDGQTGGRSSLRAHLGHQLQLQAGVPGPLQHAGLCRPPPRPSAWPDQARPSPCRPAPAPQASRICLSTWRSRAPRRWGAGTPGGRRPCWTPWTRVGCWALLAGLVLRRQGSATSSDVRCCWMPAAFYELRGARAAGAPSVAKLEERLSKLQVGIVCDAVGMRCWRSDACCSSEIRTLF
jgi:hypothetical protein